MAGSEGDADTSMQDAHAKVEEGGNGENDGTSVSGADRGQPVEEDNHDALVDVDEDEEGEYSTVHSSKEVGHDKEGDTTLVEESATMRRKRSTDEGEGSVPASAKEGSPMTGKTFSTAPTQEVMERYAPGSAPFWVGSGGVVGAAAGTGAMMHMPTTAATAGKTAVAESATAADSTVVGSGTGASGATATHDERSEQARAGSADGKTEAASTQAASGPASKQQSISTLPRNLPVKRYDGEALSRADLQHNVLARIFGDNQRVFHNPRPGPAGPSGSTSWRTPVPAYPPGMARGATRRSDETEQEYEEYDRERSAFEAVPFKEKRNGLVKREDEKETVSTVPDVLRPRENGLPQPGNALLTFKEIFIEQLVHSSKCTKAMRDKLVAEEEFAEDFAKVCLLVNVGRINTTLAFYPEMKTILRSYHPLPSLQRGENTRRNLQDAPRMKSLLKAVLLDDERPGQPGSGTATGALAARSTRSAASNGDKDDVPNNIPDLVRRLQRDVDTPPTSAVNLLFILMSHSSEITSIHFEHPHDFFTLFFPHPEVAVPSKQRAQAFLWLMWHYLEGGVLLPPGSHPNPYDDDFSRESTKQARAAWDAMSLAEQDRIRAQGHWKGSRNPAYAEYKKQRATQNTSSRDTPQDGEASTMKSSEAPPEYLNRILCPKLEMISFQESAKENTDSTDELSWATEMKEERRKFLVRFQEEEQAKVQEGRGASSGADASLDASGSGKRKGKDKAGKKRASHIGGGSSYPLANILAAANAEKVAAAAAANSAERDGRTSKRARRDGTVADDDADSTPASDAGPDKADTLWELDLTLPAHLAPPKGLLKPRGTRSDNPSTPNSAAFLPSSSTHSLPRLAWRRILERAQRGVGDASYESDDEETAQDEARDERPRAELARILACLREVRTHRGNISPMVRSAAAPSSRAT